MGQGARDSLLLFQLLKRKVHFSFSFLLFFVPLQRKICYEVK